MGAYKRVVLTEQSKITPSSTSADVKKHLSKFDNTYTSKKLNELYNEFDSITFNDVQSSAVLKASVAEVKVNENLKTIVYLTTAVIVTILLAFLAIYNIFVINALNSNIKLLQEDVAIAEAQYQELSEEINKLTESELKALIAQRLSGNYKDISSNGTSQIPTLETKNVNDYATETNWFDKFCNFFSNLFGG